MGRFRIYPSQTNTIIENDPLINTGLNEVAELWYGDNGVARILVKFDIDDYMNLWDDNLVPSITSVTSTLNFFDCATYQSGATSFDIDVHTQTQPWDQGVGYDHVGLNVEEGFSNWYSAQTFSAWTTPGGDTTILLGSQHFDGLNEDMRIDISSDIGYLWDQFTGDNHGILLKFSESDEALSSSGKRVKKFYTHHTHDYKLPFLQLDWNSRITEDRSNVVSGQEDLPDGTDQAIYIYLFTQKNGKMENIYSANSVTISGETSRYLETIYSDDERFSNPEAGVYKIRITAPTDEVYSDTWSIQTSAGLNRSIVKHFTASTIDNSWVVDSENFDRAYNYVFSVPTLNSKYMCGDKIYLPIFARKEFTNDYVSLKSLEYKISLIDGNDEFVMEDWSYASFTTNENFIILNTIWYLSGYSYKIEFRYYDAASLKYSTFERTFEIV